jgi:hypothetical protein
MSTAELIREIEEHGATLRLSGEDIKVRPASRVPLELIERLKENKPAVVDALKESPALESTEEVYGLFRRYFDTTPFDPEDHPLPPVPKGRDPLARRTGDKVRFYRRGEAWRNLPPHLIPPPAPPRRLPLYPQGRDEPAETGATRFSYLATYPRADERRKGMSTPSILFTAESDLEATRYFERIKAAQSDKSRAEKMRLERLDVRADVRINGTGPNEREKTRRG